MSKRLCSALVGAAALILLATGPLSEAMRVKWCFWLFRLVRAAHIAGVASIRIQ